MLVAVVLIPAVLGVLAYAIRHVELRRSVLHLGAILHSVSTLWLCFSPPIVKETDWIGLDAPGRLFLAVSSLLFLVASFYATGYLKAEQEKEAEKTRGGHLRVASERQFIGSMLLFLSTMSFVCISQHLGLIWIAVEATTLASASLISFHRNNRSLEATWKYLLICSVGIALALIGIFFLSAASRGHVEHFTFQSLLAHATSMDVTWLKASFILLLVGYGTKMGLAPMHTWLPDAHSEAPSVVSALLSGALLNCAFLGLLRGHSILERAGLGEFSGELLIILGLLSMGIAAVFIVRQTDFKRMLAYSSIEHMGILALGVGIGGVAATGAMLHALNHSMAKGLLFLAAGNILAAYETKTISGVQGMLKRMPFTACLWLAGFLAITGAPPFGLFVSELTVLKGAVAAKYWTVTVLYLLALAVVFIGMARLILPMVFGVEKYRDGLPFFEATTREPLWSLLPPLVLAMIVTFLGLFIPPFLWNALVEAAAAIGGH